MKITVVGAGITGITTAYFLAKAGHEVVTVSYTHLRAHET